MRRVHEVISGVGFEEGKFDQFVNNGSGFSGLASITDYPETRFAIVELLLPGKRSIFDPNRIVF